jgi:peptidyl-prolyl cis-trans isomerase C
MQLDSAPSGGGGMSVKTDHASRAGPPVATISGRTLSVGDLQHKLDQQSPFARSRYRDPEKMKDFVDSTLKFEVLAEEAMARGYHQEPEALDAVKKIIVQKLSREVYDKGVKITDVGDAEMRAYYDEHKDEYNKPEMIRASVIVVAFGGDKGGATETAAAAQKAAADPARIDDRNHFKALVKQYSTDEGSKQLGGDLRYLAHDKVVERFGQPALDALVAAEKVNAVTPVVEGADAFYIFKRTGKRKPIVRDFDAVRSQIRNKLYRDKKTEKFNAWIDELKTKYGVKLHEENFSKLDAGSGPPPTRRDPHDPPAPGSAPPGAPGGDHP